MENERIKILLQRQKVQIFAEVTTVIHQHEFQADSDWRRVQRLIILLQVMNNSDEINCFKNNFQNIIGIFVKLTSKVFNGRIEANSKVANHASSRKDWSKIRTLMNSRPEFKELQNEVNCMNDSRDFWRCWSSSQWTITRSQSTGVISTISWSRRDC